MTTAQQDAQDRLATSALRAAFARGLASRWASQMRNIIVLALALISGCATPTGVEEPRALVSDPEWPSIQARVKDTVIKRDGLLGWETAGYTPVARGEDTWVVVVSANYPLNTLGHNIDIEIAKDGKILRYERRWEKRQ